jgi:hypothetical protein
MAALQTHQIIPAGEVVEPVPQDKTLLQTHKVALVESE